MKISIRWALILGILGLIWGTQLIITSSTYLSSQDVLLRHARDIMNNIADLTMEQSEKHLSLAQGAAHLTKRLISSNVVSGEQDRHQQLERYFLNQLAIYPHFAGIYLGSPNGDFYYVNRSVAAQREGFRTKVIRYLDGRRQTSLLWRDKDLNKLEQRSDPEDTYDPRQRPWYRKAVAEKTIVWTDPYIFFTSRKPGITIAGPIFEGTGHLRGVVGVDIEIDQLSDFIGKLRIGKNGRAFMLNNNGDVVAFPDVTKIMSAPKSGEEGHKLVKIQALQDDLSRAAYGAVQWQHDDEGRIVLDKALFARFVHKGEPYHAMFAPFKNPQWPWIIGVYLPESDYLGTLKANRRTNIYVTIGLSVLATLVGLWLAGGVIRPLAALEREALAIKQHDLSRTVGVDSVYKEIQETADSFARMKEGLKSGEEKYRRIFENIQDVYYESDLDGKLLEVSPYAEHVSDFTREELIGMKSATLFPDREEYEKLNTAVITKGKVSNYEVAMQNKDGSIEYCSITASVKLNDEGHPEKIIGSLHVITDRKKADMQLRRYQDRLEELVWERTEALEKTNRQLREEMEERRKQAEEQRKLEQRFQQIQRLEGIGTLAGGVAHDFNNLLMGIQGNVSLMLLEFKDESRHFDKLKGIERCVSAGAELTRQLLGFARGGKYLVKPVDFNKIVSNTARMFGRTRKEISVIEKLHPGLWTVMADQGQVEQVLLNIYINAWQAMPDGGNIYVETRNMTVDAAFAKTFEITPGRYVRIAVTDTGTGMDKEIQQRIFEPFFTTKEIGRGTGLGLASAYGIVKNHDGAIDFSSEPGQGTTFYLYLPATDDEIVQEVEPEQDLVKGTETILLVDDETVVLNAIAPMLEELGYDVMLANGGLEAVELYNRHAERIDLVILDLIMPDLGGGAVFDKLKEKTPNVKVLLSSGYSMDGQAEAIMARGCMGFIQKPFKLDQFGAVIRDILEV